MSSGYASRLKTYPNKGKCGLPEQYDSKRTLKIKLKKLFDLVESSKRIVFLTGAGISTAAGVPDFRGPKGIWTVENENKQQKRKKRKADKMEQSNNANEDENEEQSNIKNDPKITTNMKAQKQAHHPQNEFTRAKPTLTHRAIHNLISQLPDKFKFCITQNVDGLHSRSGLHRSKLSILHGCVFMEKCELCHTEYLREYDVGGVSFQKTGNFCDQKLQNNKSCNGALRDTVLDWDDALPEPDWGDACHQCADADLVICLGTSLRIEPAGSLPLDAAQFVVVNLQATPKDRHSKCVLVVRSRVDLVMEELCGRLGVEFL